MIQGKPWFIYFTDGWGGRTTFFACVFLAGGIALAFLGKLTAQYIALAGAIQTLMTIKSAADDYHDRNSATGVQSVTNR